MLVNRDGCNRGKTKTVTSRAVYYGNGVGRKVQRQDLQLDLGKFLVLLLEVTGLYIADRLYLIIKGEKSQANFTYFFHINVILIH